MSTARTTETNKVLNRIFIVLGAIIIAATYVYLIVGASFTPPTEEANATLTDQSALIAIIGYLVGAILIAIGAINRLTTISLALIPVAIALNIVVGQIVSMTGLSVIYLDAIGTVLVSVLAGPAAGVVAGILTNVIWGLLLNPVSLPFAVTQVVIAVIAGYAAQIGLFRKFYWAPIAGAFTGVVAAAVSAPISAYVYGGVTSAGTGAIVGFFQAAGVDTLWASFFQGLISDPLDKLITFVIVVVLLAALPGRFRQRFPFAREYNVFGKTTPSLPATNASTDQQQS